MHQPQHGKGAESKEVETGPLTVVAGPQFFELLCLFEMVKRKFARFVGDVIGQARLDQLRGPARYGAELGRVLLEPVSKCEAYQSLGIGKLHQRCQAAFFRVHACLKTALDCGSTRRAGVNVFLEKLGFWCSAYDIAHELVCVAHLGKPSRCWRASLSCSLCRAGFDARAPRAELLREARSETARKAGQHFQDLERSGALRYRATGSPEAGKTTDSEREGEEREMKEVDRRSLLSAAMPQLFQDIHGLEELVQQQS